MDLTSLLFPLLILLLFIPIFLSGRRQRRQLADMQALQASLEPGDVVVTTSGLRATVIDSSYEDTVDLEIADNVVTTWVRASVREKVVPAVDPAESAPAPAELSDTAAASETAPAVETLPAADDRPSLDKSPSLEKDDSTNGTPRT